MITPSTLAKEISAGKFKPAYYFFGAEDYRIAEAEKFVAHQFLPDRQLLTNYRRIDASRTRLADLLNELAALPMLGERQVFAISSFQSYSAKDVDRVLGMIDLKISDRIIVFSSPSSKVSKRSAPFVKKMDKALTVVEFGRLSSSEMTRHIRGKLDETGIAIEPEALQLLLELISGSRGALLAETAKLVDYKQAGDTITVDDIRQVAAGHEVFDVFQVADFVIAGDTSRVLQSIRSLLAGGNSPASITTLMSQHFMSLYMVKNGKPPLGNRGFLVGKFRQQASRFDNRRLEQIIIRIAETDAELRHQRLKPEMALEVMALRLIGERAAAHG